MRILFIYLLLWITQMAGAQETAGKSSLDTYRKAFKTLGISDGLRSNSVTCLLADSRGYLWIGTTQGLNRYDGYEVKTRFPESGDQQLREVFNNSVTSLEEDAEGRIWIECESGAYYLYDTKTAQFSASANQLLQGIGIPCDGRYKVKVGEKGALWVLTKNNIYRYDCNNKNLKTWETRLQVTGITANVVMEMSDGLYISVDHAIWHFMSATGELQRENLPEVMQQSIGESSMMADADGSLWIYSTREENICRYIVGGRNIKEMVHLPHTKGASQNNAIRDMIDDRRGNIWIATDHGGLFIYNKKTGTITSVQRQRDHLLSLASDNVTCLALDREGTVWMGHFKTGLSYTNDANIILHPHALESGDVLAMEYDTQGNLWLGTDGDGIYMEKPNGTIVKTSLPNITVMDLLSDGQGGMWVGTYNQGLYHMFDANRWKRYATDDGTFPSEQVWTLASDGHGNVWTSSTIGCTVIFNVNDERATVVKTSKGEVISGNNLFYDHDNTMYIASVYGLWSYNLKTGACSVAFGNRKGTQQWMNQMITDIDVDKKKQMMVLAHAEGVTVFDMKNDTLYYIRRNDDVVKGFARDHDGVYWLCTSSSSVSGIKPERKAGGIDFIHRNFQHSTRMPQFFFNGDAMICSPDGKILMGGTEGYMSINPRQLMTAKLENHDLVISEIAIGDSLLNETTSTITLSHDAAFLTVKFFSGSLEGEQRIRYAYRLLDQMSDWVITEHNYVSFHALRPGDYTLQLCVYREDGTMSEPRELRISVAPPFYRSLPMYVLYVLIAVGLALLLLHMMRKRQRERNEHQRQMMERQKAEQITEMKLQFFTNISHDLRTPLTLIISPLEQMVKKMEEGKNPNNLLTQLKNIHKNAKLLLNEVSALLDFRRLDAGGETLNLQRGDIVDHLNSILVSFGDYAEERDIHLSFDQDVDSFIMDYDREKMNKVVYNLFSNALKFTPSGGSVSLSFRHQNDNVTIVVADTGKGIADSDKPNIFKRFYQSASNDSSQTGSGIGLHIANDYVRLHGGTISVGDNKPIGSVFTITLPMENGMVKNEQSAVAVPSPAGAPEGDSSQSTVHSSHKTLLIVDDNHDMLSFLSSCMKELYEVRTATDGASALEILHHESVDLVISDVMMPGIDGFELCRRLKTDINLSHIPIILLTARTTDVSRIEGLQLGADDYLTKPFNIEVLRLRVKKFIEWEQNNHRQFRQKMNIEPSEITITPIDEQFIKKAISLVEDNISDSDFSVETLAAEVGMARSTLYKKLMAITGQGPAEFIRIIRIKRGRALLEASQMQITEIAYAVGFTTVKSFTMNFKAEYGMTPSEFRNSNLPSPMS